MTCSLDMTNFTRFSLCVTFLFVTFHICFITRFATFETPGTVSLLSPEFLLLVFECKTARPCFLPYLRQAVWFRYAIVFYNFQEDFKPIGASFLLRTRHVELFHAYDALKLRVYLLSSYGRKTLAIPSSRKLINSISLSIKANKKKTSYVIISSYGSAHQQWFFCRVLFLFVWSFSLRCHWRRLFSLFLTDSVFKSLRRKVNLIRLLMITLLV